MSTTGQSINRSDYLLAAPAVLFALVFIIVPLLITTAISFFTYKIGAAGASFGFIPILTTENWVDILTDPLYLHVTAITLEVAAVVTFLSFAVGYPVAYTLALKVKNDRVRLIILFLLIVQFWVDFSIRVLGWFPILGYEGYLNAFLLSIGLQRTSALLFSPASAIMVELQSYILFLIFPVLLSMSRIEPDLAKAAQTLGADRLRTFYHVHFRMSVPGLVVGIVFVFVMSMSDFATPAIVGGSLSTVGNLVRGLSSKVNFPLASAFAMLLTLVTVVLVMIVLRVVDIKRLIF